MFSQAFCQSFYKRREWGGGISGPMSFLAGEYLWYHDPFLGSRYVQGEGMGMSGTGYVWRVVCVQGGGHV